MRFTNEVTSMKGVIINNILLTGLFMKKDEYIELSKPFMYDNNKLTHIDKFGNVTIWNSSSNRVDISMNDMDVESLAQLADILMNERNYRIVKN
jgi:hypothetical protein